MNSRTTLAAVAALAFGILAVAAGRPPMVGAASAALTPSALPRLGTVDERYQSYNVEMAEVIGARFWKPYSKDEPPNAPALPAKAEGRAMQIGVDPGMFASRPPANSPTRACGNWPRRSDRRSCASAARGPTRSTSTIPMSRPRRPRPPGSKACSRAPSGKASSTSPRPSTRGSSRRSRSARVCATRQARGRRTRPGACWPTRRRSAATSRRRNCSTSRRFRQPEAPPRVQRRGLRPRHRRFPRVREGGGAADADGRPGVGW